MLAKLVTINFNFTTKSCILHLFVKNGKTFVIAVQHIICIVELLSLVYKI